MRRNVPISPGFGSDHFRFVHADCHRTCASREPSLLNTLRLCPVKTGSGLARLSGLNLMASGGREEGGAGHAALPSLVIDRFEQPAVEGDVDPP